MRRHRLVGAVQALLAAAAVIGATWLVLDGRVEEREASGGVAVATPPLEGGSLQPRSPAAVRLSGADSFRVELKRRPRAALVFDVDTGRVLYRRHPLRVLPIASLTKIMTALAVTRASRPDEAVRVPKNLRYEGSAVGVLPKGRRVRLEPLLGGLLLVSGNDAAIVLARHLSGSERRFVALMNEKARLWGLTCTRFASAHGLEDGNRSCAADIAVLTRLAMRDRRIARIARRGDASYRFPIKGRRLYLAGHNPLIRSGYRGAIGLKTGYTDAAGRCFVGVARRGGRTLGVVLLDSFDPGRQAARLLDRAFASS